MRAKNNRYLKLIGNDAETVRLHTNIIRQKMSVFIETWNFPLEHSDRKLYADIRLEIGNPIRNDYFNLLRKLPGILSLLTEFSGHLIFRFLCTRHVKGYPFNFPTVYHT